MVRTSCCTICGSDVHAWTGSRPPTFLPAILGHEVAGVVADPGDGRCLASDGTALLAGDRVTFTLTASCGTCFYCSTAGLPQKCDTMFKYGHTECEGPRGLTGGLAEYIQVVPGTGVFRVPEGVSDEVAATAMCAGATLANAFDGLADQDGLSVLLMGAGMLGLWGIRLAMARGAETILVSDVDAGRLDYAARWGATDAVQGDSEKALLDAVRVRTNGRGVDLCIDLTGRADAIAIGLRALRTGGTMKLVGSVVPAGDLAIDPMALVTRSLTVQGVHNYHPRHLHQALELVTDAKHHEAISRAVGARFALDDVDVAFRAAHERAVHRVAIIFR